MNPAMMGGGLQTFTALGGAAVIAMIGYVLQLGSYFGSWRLGFGEGETLAGAIVYGLIAGVLVIVAFVAVLHRRRHPHAGVAVPGRDPDGVAVPAAGGRALHGLGGAIAIVMFIVMLLVLAFGASMSDMDPAAALTGGGGVAVLVILALLAVLLWLSARFSCATSVMADRRTFNLLTGLSDPGGPRRRASGGSSAISPCSRSS